MKNNTSTLKPTVEMFGLRFDQCTLKQAVKMVVDAGLKREKSLVVTPNVDHVVMLENDEDMRCVFQSAKFCFADGMPVVWMSKLLKKALPERVTGADLLPAIAGRASEVGVRLFLLGGQEGVAKAAAYKLQEKHPNLQIVGTYCPPFGFEYDEEENKKIIAIINDSEADILFVGVGAPKQEKWAAKHQNQLHVGPILGVGAAFDFVAGNIKRAPSIIQRIGFEWLWRLMSDPKRLWRRYLINDPKFILLSLRELRRAK